jgi:hypothetical protein
LGREIYGVFSRSAVCLEELKNVAPQNDEERQNVFMLKKQIVDTLVHRATIDRNREIVVDIRLNLLAILDQDTNPTMLDLAYIGKDEIYTHIQSLPSTYFVISMKI